MSVFAHLGFFHICTPASRLRPGEASRKRGPNCIVACSYHGGDYMQESDMLVVSTARSAAVGGEEWCRRRACCKRTRSCRGTVGGSSKVEVFEASVMDQSTETKERLMDFHHER